MVFKEHHLSSCHVVSRQGRRSNWTRFSLDGELIYMNLVYTYVNSLVVLVNCFRVVFILVCEVFASYNYVSSHYLDTQSYGCEIKMSIESSTVFWCVIILNA